MANLFHFTLNIGTYIIHTFDAHIDSCCRSNTSNKINVPKGEKMSHPWNWLMLFGSKRMKVDFCFSGNQNGTRMAGGSPADVCATIAQQLGLDVHPSICSSNQRTGGLGLSQLPLGYTLNQSLAQSRANVLKPTTFNNLQKEIWTSCS